MEDFVSEEEKKSGNTSEETEKTAEVASDNDAPQPFPKKTLPWLAMCVFAVVAVIFTWSAVSPVEYETLALVSFSRFIQLIFALTWFVLFFAILKKLPLWVRGIIFACFFLPAAFSIYLQKLYGMGIDYAFVSDCLNTHWQEARAFFSLYAIGILLGFVVLMFVVAWLVGKVPAKLPSSKKIIVGLVAVLAISAILPSLSRCIFPVDITVRTAHWTVVYYGNRTWVEHLTKMENETQDVERVPAEISHVRAVPVVVLHIGETARADHAPFNGYARNTMPNMLKEYEAGNLISFPKCVSFANETTFSTRGIFTPSTVLDDVFRHPTFIPALNQSGIETCGFLSSLGMHEWWIGQLLGKTQKIINTESPALSLLPKIREKLAEDEKKSPARERFYFYYGEGSHEPFIHYDYDRHSVFKPTGKRKYGFGDERDVNNYDNTFVATDEFCGGFIDALRNENAVYIFVGDHGTMLGEDGRQGRSFRRKEVRHVLFFVWASEKFKVENPWLWATLVRNRKRLGVVSHDFVYNSVLHLFSLKTPFYDEKADLFSDSAEPFPTEMPEAKSFGPPKYGENAEEYHEFSWKDLF